MLANLGPDDGGNCILASGEQRSKGRRQWSATRPNAPVLFPSTAGVAWLLGPWRLVVGNARSGGENLTAHFGGFVKGNGAVVVNLALGVGLKDQRHDGIKTTAGDGMDGN